MSCPHLDYDDYFNRCNDCGAEGLMPEGDTQAELSHLLRDWTNGEGLPFISADELLYERGNDGELITNKEQRQWLEYFIVLWEDAEEEE